MSLQRAESSSWMERKERALGFCFTRSCFKIERKQNKSEIEYQWMKNDHIDNILDYRIDDNRLWIGLDVLMNR